MPRIALARYFRGMDMRTRSGWMPFEITPESIHATPGPDGLCDYLSDTEKIDKLLTERKSVVFRGFEISPGQLEKVMDLLLKNRLSYIHGNSPRTKVGNNIYTSTEYPPNLDISMHNELSYAATWPARILFFCELAATAHGRRAFTGPRRVLVAMSE